MYSLPKRSQSDPYMPGTLAGARNTGVQMQTHSQSTHSLVGKINMRPTNDKQA